ncbi:MAG: flavin reductase [Bacillota bacterium]|nr:flavin reductase [Bacillota bacterium]
MSEIFKSISPEDISENVFKLIGEDWTLITAGTLEKHNTMTASWGGFGVLWGKKVAFIFVRPQRYTYEFLEKQNNFTLSFFGQEYRDVLKLCGSKSGRDINKVAEAGITPIGEMPGKVYFKESRLVIITKKLYFQDINPENFLDPEIAKNYPGKDYHRLYIGEIENVLIKND